MKTQSEENSLEQNFFFLVKNNLEVISGMKFFSDTFNFFSQMLKISWSFWFQKLLLFASSEWQTSSTLKATMRSPEPSSPSPEEALLHGQFASWGSGSSSSSCPDSPEGSGGLSPTASPAPAPASNYALTLTHTHIHIQRLSPRPGKEARLLLPLSELVGCSCPRSPAPPLLVLYWYPPGKRRKGVSRRRQVRAYLAENRPEAEKWSAAVQCLLREVPVTANTGECLFVPTLSYRSCVSNCLLMFVRRVFFFFK